VTTIAAVPPHPKRFVFLGTPALAAETLRVLVREGFDIALVVTRIDKRRGRGSELSPSPVKAAAVELGLPVAHRVDDALAVGADLGIVVAFGQLIKRPVLEQLPMVNVHFSLLPRWRGAAPMERALLAGDTVTGVSLMQLEVGLDTGPVFATSTIAIEPTATGDSLRRDLTQLGAGLLVRHLRDGFGVPTPQEGEPVHAAKIDPAELKLDWSRPVAELDQVIRLGGAWTTANGKRVKILAATLAGDRLEITRVQPEGKAPMNMQAFRNGIRWTDTDHWGS
jgi:methionyl-tRNA formyltransferase